MFRQAEQSFLHRHSIIKDPIVAFTSNTHSISHLGVLVKGVSKLFRFGHGDETRTRIPRFKGPLQNQFCYTVLKSSKRLTLDLWFIHCPQRKTRPASAVFPYRMPIAGHRHIFNCQRSMSFCPGLGGVSTSFSFQHRI